MWPDPYKTAGLTLSAGQAIFRKQGCICYTLGVGVGGHGGGQTGLGLIRAYKPPSSETLDSDALFPFPCCKVHHTRLLNSRNLTAAFSTLSDTAPSFP